MPNQSDDLRCLATFPKLSERDRDQLLYPMNNSGTTARLVKNTSDAPSVELDSTRDQRAGI